MQKLSPAIFYFAAQTHSGVIWMNSFIIIIHDNHEVDSYNCIQKF